MTSIEPGFPEPARPSSPRPRWLIPTLAALGVVIVAAASVAITLAISGNGDDPGAEEAAEVFTVHGTLQLDAAGSLNVASGGGPNSPCDGDGGYDDIHEGSQVKVTAPDGEVLAIGELSAGHLAAPGALGNYDRFGVCEFRFEVGDVPTGHGIYGIEVSNRGVVNYPEEELGSVLNGPALTLGG